MTAAQDRQVSGGRYQSHASIASEAGTTVAKDPVCKMMVDPHTAKHPVEHNGDTVYFCPAGCRTKFIANPNRYLDPASTKAQAEPVPAGMIYTCPMHPEVRQVGPGACPFCGMALEPASIGADSGPSEELADMTHRFWIGLVLTIPVFVLEMGGHLFGIADRIGQQTSNWVQFALATPVRGGRAARLSRGWRPRPRAARREGRGGWRSGRGPLVGGRVHGDGRVVPVTKEAGPKVVGGTLNQTGALIIRAERVGRDTMLSRIVQMVGEAQRSRAPIQRLADRVAGWFMPTVLGVALIAFVLWMIFGPEPRFSFALLAAVAVLIIACPCALGLARPCRSWWAWVGVRRRACWSKTPRRWSAWSGSTR